MPLITVEIVAESPHLVEGSGIVSAWCVGGEVSGPASTGSHQPGVSFGMRTPAFDCIPADHGLDNSMLQVLNCKHNAMLTSVQSPRQGSKYRQRPVPVYWNDIIRRRCLATGRPTVQPVSRHSPAAACTHQQIFSGFLQIFFARTMPDQEMSPKAKVTYDQHKFEVELNVTEYLPEVRMKVFFCGYTFKIRWNVVYLISRVMS